MWVIGGALWLGLLPALGTYHLNTPELRSAAAVAAVFVPIAVAPLWWTVRRDPKTAGFNGAVEGASATIAHYNAAAGVGVALWALTLIHVAGNFSDLRSVIDRVLHSPVCKYYLFSEKAQNLHRLLCVSVTF